MQLQGREPFKQWSKERKQVIHKCEEGRDTVKTNKDTCMYHFGPLKQRNFF